MMLVGILMISFSIGNQISAQIDNYTISTEQGAMMTATADAKGMAIATLKQGTRVEMVRKDTSFTKIEYNGRLGWVPNEALKPFTKELLPVYASYYKLLDQTEDIVYAIIYDFTQDGIEDLYLVVDTEPSKGQYTEMIYSGEEIIYQKNLKHGLTILKDATDYYLFHHKQINGEKKFKLVNLNDQAKTDYQEISDGKNSFEILANTYINSYYIVQSGDGNLLEQTFTHNQVASKDYTESELANEVGETIYRESYSLSTGGKTKTLLQKEYEELFSHYEQARGFKIVYSDDANSASLSDSFSFQVDSAKQEILSLAEKVVSSKQLEGDAEDLAQLKIKLAQSVILEMPYEQAIARNSLTYMKQMEKGILYGLAGYDLNYFEKSDVETPMDDTYYADSSAVDLAMYDFYGKTIDTTEYANLAASENRYLDEGHYQFPVEEQQATTYNYRQLQAVKQLEGYDALQFVDYELPADVIVTEGTESLLIAGKKVNDGYVLFKRLPFKAGVKWVYVDTVKQVDELDTTQYQAYEESLGLVQRYLAQQTMEEDEGEEPDEVVVASANTEKVAKIKESQQTDVSWGMLLVGISAFVCAVIASYFVYRKRYS